MRPRPLVLLLAVGLDLAAGEPPSAWHPVAWIGRALAAAERQARRRTVADGLVSVAAVAAGVWAVATGAGALTRRLGWLGVVIEALALKPAFAARRLAGVAGEVEAALRADDLDGARRLVGWHLVSRDTKRLEPPEVASAAVESVAENLADSVVGPLLCYGMAGLPGAWAYRTLNTADAMWGYRDARHERFGKAAARLDDAANLVPSRLSAVALAGGAVLVGERGAGAWRVACRDHGRTASPNAGWPMAAMAGALAVRLEKRGQYRLGDGALPDSPDVIGRAVRVFGAAGALAVAALFALAVIRRARP